MREREREREISGYAATKRRKKRKRERGETELKSDTRIRNAQRDIIADFEDFVTRRNRVG